MDGLREGSAVGRERPVGRDRDLLVVEGELGGEFTVDCAGEVDAVPLSVLWTSMKHCLHIPV